MTTQTWTPVLLAASLLVIGCTHKHAFSHERIERSVAIPAFQGKTVAVHLVEPDVRNEYTGGAGGHKFKIVDVHTYLQGFFNKMADGAAGMRFVNTPQPAGADLELYPKLDIELGGSLLSDCTARLEMVAKDSAGRVVAQASAEDSTTFTVMSTGGLSCEQSTLLVLGPVIDSISAGVLAAGPLPAAAAAPAPVPAAPAPAPAAVAPPPAAGGCTKDTDCKGDRLCQAGQCVFAQPAAASAPPPPAAGCAKDTDCKGNRVCQAGQCVAATTPAPAPAAAGCRANTDCKLGRVCRAGDCVSP